jgi:O-antigen ligase
MAWAILQALPIVPSGWMHPIWHITAGLLQHPTAGTISLNPWRTLSQVTKLTTYIAVTWMVFTLTRNIDRAKQLLNAIIAIGAAYAVYAFALSLFGIEQFSLFYSLPSGNLYHFSGPFALHNSFATLEGLAALASLARLVELASEKILVSRGVRRWLLTTLQFMFGSGVLVVVATILTISALVASASRGGFFSTCAAIITMAIPFSARLKHNVSRRWVLIGAASLALTLIILVWINGESLNSRIADLIDAGSADEIRLALWAAARRMITDAPFLGLGLGTFQDAYPMYATKLFPFIMDKAHCDYLEFAAGLGLPAAICWWVAIVWCVGQLVRGLFIRRKDRIYPLVGLGSTILVAVHSSVDFSLQIPAVAMTYAALLGIGLAQSYSSQRSTDHRSPQHALGNPLEF